jgi:hypothetical protein
MSNAEDNVKAESKEADPNIVSIKVRGQVRVKSFAPSLAFERRPAAHTACGRATPQGQRYSLGGQRDAWIGRVYAHVLARREASLPGHAHWAFF